MQELYTVGTNTYTCINMALIEEAKTGTKMLITQFVDSEAQIDRTLGTDMIINDDEGNVLHAFEINTGLDDLATLDIVTGKTIEVESIEIYGKNIDKIKFTEDFKRDLENSAENAVNEMMQNA